MDAKASIGGCIAAIQVLAIIATPLPAAQPVAVADNQYVTIKDTQLTVVFPGVLANDVAQRPVDSDGDGFLDSEELTHGSSPGNSNSIPSVGRIVSTKTELATAVSSASAGDIIVMAEGTYTNLVQTISRSGTSGNPITIRSRTVGGAVITGTSSIILGGSHLVLDGVKFTNGNPSDSQGAIRVNGSYNRVTNCSVVGFNRSDPLVDTDWIGLNGQYNRVDHCVFSGKIGPGPLFVVWRSINKPDYHQIDHNVFKDYAAGTTNGYETMRVGTSGDSQTSSYTVVESNYFENCDGEVEIISNKSCNNTYRGNTFVSCYGSLTLRHGNSCLVEGNVFLANGKNSVGGIRIIDKDHVVRNNYIEGSRNRGGLILSTARVNPALNEYWEVRNVLLANNSVINSSNSFYYGERDEPLPPIDITFSNNIARNNINGDGQYNIIYQRHPITNPTYSGEVYFGSDLGITPTPPGVETNVNPDLVQNAQGLWIDSGGKGAQNITRLYESDCGPLSRAPLTATLATGVGENGTLNLDTNGGFTFMPAPGVTGPVTFTYHANDGGEASATPATVTIHIRDNTPPTVDAGPVQSLLHPGATNWTPANLGVAAWYDAADTATVTAPGGTVSQWVDKSGHGFDLTASVGNPQSGANINGLPALDFTDDRMTTASNPFGSTVNDAFLIAVHRVDALQNGTFFSLTGEENDTSKRWQAHAPYRDGTVYFDCGGAGSPNRVSTGFGVGAGDVILSGFYGSTTDNVQQIYKNGTLLVGDSSGHAVSTVGNMLVGGVGIYQDTTIGELIVINGTVSAEDRRKLEGYLAHKWGLTTSLPAGHPYISAAPMVPPWSASLDGTASDSNGDDIETVWSVASGPPGATFADVNAIDTTVYFENPGIYTLRLTADDSFAQTWDEVVITVGDIPAYEAWAAANAPGSAADDDSDNDGVPNGIEFVLGGDKDTNDVGKLPTVATPGADMTFTFIRDRASVDPSVSVEIVVGPDLATWPDVFTVGADTASSTEGITVTDNGDGTDTITLTLTLTLTKEPDTKKFARLVVVITP